MVRDLLLVGLTIVFALLCVIFRRKGKSFEGMICKFLASFGFIAIAIFGNYINHVNIGFYSCVLAALMFSFFGDVLLGIKEIAPVFKKKLIALGTASFLLGHIFCIAAFSFFKMFNWWTAIATIVGGLTAFSLCNIFKVNINPKLKILLYIYYGFLFWKVAATGWLLYTDCSKSNMLLLISSILFIISDTCLAFLYFTPIKRKNVFVSLELATYYPAQMLLALSIIFLSK